MSESTAGPLVARVIAGIVLGIEALALSVAGAAYVAYGMAAAEGDRAFAIAVALFAFGAAAALAAAAWGIWRGRRWAASLAITWQVLQAAVGAYAVTVQPTAGAIIIVLAVVGGAAAMRSTRAA